MKKTKKKRTSMADSLTFKSAILAIFILALIFNLYSLFFKSILHTGFDISSTTGLVSLFIESNPKIEILSPLNITYNFSIGQPNILDLNVSSDMPIDSSSWRYRLYDNKHKEWGGDWIAFSPNITFNAFRWSNQLYVMAQTPSGRLGEANVTFFVFVNNSAPVLYGINSPIQICEGTSLDYPFYAIDIDEDENPYPSKILSSFLSPASARFGVYLDNWNRTRFNFTLYSGIMIKGLGTSADVMLNTGFSSYIHNVSVIDGQYSDFKQVNIAVVEKNNPPVIEDITGKTIWNKGNNSNLYEIIDVNDLEYNPPFGYGNLTFSDFIKNSTGSPVNLFNVSFNGSVGIINFTADNSTPLGGYNVTVCVSDTGLTNRHPNISRVCNQTGGSITTCDYFSLAITDQNRWPTIVKYYPENLSLNESGNTQLYFNITKYDPDGSIPDAYWYVDGVLKQYNEGNISDKFFYTFGCGYFGLHNVSVVISDGLLNDSLMWNVTIQGFACSVPGGSSGGGGGGGAAMPTCKPKWGCDSWNICQNSKASLDQGLLSGEDYRIIKNNCDLEDLSEEACGFQIRGCKDVNSCFLTSPGKPEEIQYCHYTENPSCKDGIKNCHNGDCELLVDCGGPCKSCATCTDKIKNQGEEGIDCGGPCPWRCTPVIPFFKRKEIIYGFLILLLLLIILIILKLIRVIKYQKTLSEQRKF